MLFNSLVRTTLTVSAVLSPLALAAASSNAELDVSLDDALLQAEGDAISRDNSDFLNQEDLDGSASQANALDITLKFFDAYVCPKLGGPHRDYSKGACVPLARSTRGLKIVGGRCYLHSYEDKKCTKKQKKMNKKNVCYDTQKRSSVKVVCK